MYLIIVLLIYNTLLLPRYSCQQYNEEIIMLNGLPQISVTSLELPLNDRRIMTSSYPTLTPTSVPSPMMEELKETHSFCLLMYINDPGIIMIPSTVDLFNFYLQPIESKEMNERLWAVFQLTSSSRRNSMYPYYSSNSLLTPILQYINNSLSINQIELPVIKPSSNTMHVFTFTLFNSLFIDNGVKVIGKLASPTIPSCLQENIPNFCLSLINCEAIMPSVQTTLDDHSESVPQRRRRYRRDVSSASASSSSSTNSTDTNQSSPTGLSPGLLAVAIIVPIIGVAGLAVGGYFLYRWLHSRRAAHGIYHPNQMENKANAFKEPEPQTIIKIPQEERLI
ncbi:unnamed protein product [Trichobilharzia szidati]|nr:unnamed protein product [Trichobilharzia szidati]